MGVGTVGSKLEQSPSIECAPAFRKVLWAKNTALFYQLDRGVQLMIDLQPARALPLIEP